MAQFAALGVALASAGRQDEVFEVWPENWRAFKAFLSLETQWRVSATMAGLVWTGLDIAAAGTLYRDLDGKAFRRLMAKVRRIEAGARGVLNARAEDAS